MYVRELRERKIAPGHMCPSHIEGTLKHWMAEVKRCLGSWGVRQTERNIKRKDPRGFVPHKGSLGLVL